MSSAIVCNCSSFCIDSDCRFAHGISIKDRKVVRKLYDGLVCPNKAEPNAGNRRANCKFGQICWNKDCGFRHRLCFEDRVKLIEGFNDAKISMMKTEKVAERPVVEGFVISKKNGFDCLEEEVFQEKKVVLRSWADIMDSSS